jgi:hypothetical protein
LGLGEFINGHSHSHLGVTTSINDFMVFNGGNQNADRVMDGAFSFIKNVLTTTAQDDTASFVHLASRELDNFVFTDHDLFNSSAASELTFFGVIEGGEDVSTEASSETFNSVKVGVLNNHASSFGHHLLGVVVNELSINEYIGLVS